jgi:ADP-ribose pyrophosphatase
VAYSDEKIEVWFARGLELREANLDQGEFLEVFTATPEEFLRWCAEGKVQDSKTLAAALWLQNLLSGAWKLDWKAPPSQP